MPQPGGRALFEQLREQRPQLAERFVFVTGDRARDETRRFLDECGQPAVMKPYDFNDLIPAIGQVVEVAGLHDRSEEHTSELQSRPHIACRLLLDNNDETL